MNAYDFIKSNKFRAQHFSDCCYECTIVIDHREIFLFVLLRDAHETHIPIHGTVVVHMVCAIAKAHMRTEHTQYVYILAKEIFIENVFLEFEIKRKAILLHDAAHEQIVHMHCH